MAMRALVLVIAVSLVATTLSFASNQKPKPKRIANRVADLEQAVNDLRDRVAALEGKPKKKKASDPFGACREWGKDSGYIRKMTSDYRVFKNAGLSEDEMLRGSLDACQERVTKAGELPKCRACMTAILSELFKE